MSGLRLPSGGGVTIDWKAQHVLTPANDPLFPTFVAGAIAHNFPRELAGTNASILSTGRLNLTLCPVYPGLVISKMTFISGASAAGTPTNQWFCLADPVTLALLAITSDNTTTAWGTSTARTLTLTSPYTIPAGVYSIYAGINVTATTVPTLIAAPNTSGAANGFVAATPQIVANSNTGLTTPLTVGATLAALTQSAGPVYVIFS